MLFMVVGMTVGDDVLGVPFGIQNLFVIHFKEDFRKAKINLIVVRALKAAPDTAGRHKGCKGDSASPPCNPQPYPTTVSSRGISSGKLNPIREAHTTGYS